MPNNQSLESLEVLRPVSLFLKTGKPKLLVEALMGSDNVEARKLQIMTDVIGACALGVESGEIKPNTAAKRVGTLIGLDDSKDHKLACGALESVDSGSPQAVETIVSHLSAAKLLELDPTSGEIPEMLIDYATPKQLATVARYYAGRVFAAQNGPYRNAEIKNERVDYAVGQLGLFLDLVVEREETENSGNGFLTSFATALLNDEPPLSNRKPIRSARPVEPSFTMDQILNIAMGYEASAKMVIGSLPNSGLGWEIKMRLANIDNDPG